jgi:hypothetical protein
MNMTARAFMEKCRESAAYHEAGHEVVCVARQVPIQEMGVHVDSQVCGVSLAFRRDPGNMSNTLIDIGEREDTIVLLNAGYIAQERFFPDILPESGEHDLRIVDALLDEMHQSDSQAQNDLRAKLWGESCRLVEQHWTAIQCLGQELWARPWVSRVALPPGFMGWSTDTKEKWLHGEEVQNILQKFGLVAIIRRFADGPYVKPQAKQRK